MLALLFAPCDSPPMSNTALHPMDQAKQIAEEIFGSPVFGFRCLPAGDPRYEIGEKMDNSLDWQNDECTGEELPGACCLNDKTDMDAAIRILKTYHGKDCAIYIVFGADGLRGQDPGEIIINQPHVGAIIQ